MSKNGDEGTIYETVRKLGDRVEKIERKQGEKTDQGGEIGEVLRSQNEKIAALEAAVEELGNKQRVFTEGLKRMEAKLDREPGIDLGINFGPKVGNAR